MAIGLVDDLFIDLVGNDEQIPLPGNFGNRLEALPGKNVAGRVVRAVEEDGLGFFRETPVELLPCDLKTLGRRKREGNRSRPGILPQIQIEEIHGLGNENFITRVQNREDGNHHRLGSAGGDQNFLLGIHLDPVFFPKLFGDRLS